MPQPLIVCRGVERTYGSPHARTVALAGIDLEIHAGEIVAVVGPSGSGKSTLLHLVGAMDFPDRGSVLVGGRNLAGCGDGEASRFRREEVGFIFQFFNLIPSLSALDNVALPARLAGHKARDARARARGLLDRVGLGGREDDFADAFSGGQQQRIAVARALVNHPQILLADEPTGALDRRTGEEVLALLASVARERGAILLLATHNENALAFASRMVRIEDGRVTADEKLAGGSG